MDINQIIAAFTTAGFVTFFLKGFALIFSFLFIIYAIVIAKQTQVMNATLQSSLGPLINFISFIQILVGVLLFVLAIFLI